MLLNQQGKVGQTQQFRQPNQQQSPCRSLMGEFRQTSHVPQHFAGTTSSHMPPQSPIQSQFTGSSLMYPQSPTISQHQPNSSPILPQIMIQNQSQFQQNTNSPHRKSLIIQPYSNQTLYSPIHPLSPRVQKSFTNQLQSPITTPQSPTVQSQHFYQIPNSPVTHHFNQPSSLSPPQSPRVQSEFQQPTSSVETPPSPHIQQSHFVHRHNSPIRSSMSAMSPMPIKRPSNTGRSSQIEGQINVENPSPKMEHEQEFNKGGGRDPHLNPIPAPSSLFGRCGFRKLGLRGGSPMWGSERPPSRIPTTGNAIKSNYKEDLSRNSSPLTSKSPKHKTQSLESQETTSKNDDESTVYNDIVLVENERNLEVEELQSSLQGNVMTMPMVIDGGLLQVTEMNLGSENVEGVLEDCLVSATNSVVLDVDRPGSGEETEGLQGIIDNHESESVQEDLLTLEEDLAERASKEDETGMIEIMEESMSPPTGRKRLVGKVLPGESLKKLEEKSSTDSLDQEESNDHSSDAYNSETDNEILSTTFDRKIESVSTISLDQSKEELKYKNENLKQVFPIVHPSTSQIPLSSAQQANIYLYIPSSTRSSVPYPTYPRGAPRFAFPLTKPDGRSVIDVQQAAVTNLVQDAVNAAKWAAENKQYSQGVSVGRDLIPTLSSTPSTNSSIGIVSKKGMTLNTPLRMSVPFFSSARITTDSTSSNTHFMPILSQSKGLSNVGVINEKMETDECEKNTRKHIPVGFQKLVIDRDTQNLSKPEENRTKPEVSLGSNSSKAYSYSKILMSSNTMQSVKSSDVIKIKCSESTSQAIDSFSPNYSRDTGVISSKSLASVAQHSSMKTQGKTGQIEEASSILEAQLTPTSREDTQIYRNSAVSSPFKTVFSFSDHIRDANKEPQCGNLNMSGMSVTYDDNKIHTEGLTLYGSSESIMSESSISKMLKHEVNSEIKLPVSVKPHLPDKHYEYRAVCRPFIRGIGNFNVHSRNIKSEYAEPSDPNIRGQPNMFSTDPMQIQQKSESTSVIKTEIRTQKPVLSQHQVIEPMNYSSSPTITSTKTVPTRLGELRSGGTNAHAHIERRLSVDRQSDVESTKSQFRGQLQAGAPQQKVISSSDPNMSFLSGPQMDSAVSSHFIPLSSIYDPIPSVTPGNADDSQNVLLKKLLRSAACATTSATASTTVDTVAAPQSERAQSSQPESCSVKPSSPPTQLPTSIKTEQTSPMQEQSRLSTDTQSSTMDELRSPSSSVIKRELLLTPVQIKREPGFPQLAEPKTSPITVEVKKEVVSSDENISPGIRSVDSMETGAMDHSSNVPLDRQELKKLKRRQYQQKRRQTQGKDLGTPKKRPKKSSKVGEDYDSYIDSLMVKLRQTPAMVLQEPSPRANHMVCPIFGAGDLSKVHLNSRTGQLKGSYGNATLSGSDYYSTVPYGDQLPLPPQATPSTQRGFYNEEFAPLRLDTRKDDFDDCKQELNRERDADSPDTIVSSSSPELVVPEPYIRYPGLRLIKEEDSEDEELVYRRSPVIPFVIPTAIKLEDKLSSEMDKENAFRDNPLIKTRLSPSIPLKDTANVTVTLTLTSAAADNVLGVLRNLANVLRIPAPTDYHIKEKTVTPPSRKLGLYSSKGKDGKEGANVDIQSILNGEAKFCRHCDVIITNNPVRKKSSEMPFLARGESTEDLYFCSSVCHVQLTLAQQSLAISQDKAAAVVDHLSQLDPSPVKKSRFSTDAGAGVKKKVTVKIEEPTVKLEVNLDIVKQEQPAVVEKEKPTLKGVKYRVWTSSTVPPPVAKHKIPTDKEMTETLFRMGITVMPPKLPDDTRTCLLCHQVGDGVADGPARLLNYDVDQWLHLNCALWSDEVYETVDGALMNVERVLQQSLTANCCFCGRAGATLKCYKLRCSVMYHLPCAVKDQCVFYKNKTLYCNLHVPKNEKDNELTTLAVFRRVYIHRDENRQVASVVHYTEHNNVLRVGSMILLNVGHLLPHQLAAFHSHNHIYPIGYKIVRFYWSMRVNNKRCRYICSIHEANDRPEFRVLIQEPEQEDVELRDTSAHAVWLRVLEPLAALRKASNSVQVFPQFVSGEDLFGLNEPAVVRVLESLPGVETLTDYRFKYGRNPLLEPPLAINPSGCARCEPKPRGQEKWKRAHTQRTTSADQRTDCAAASSALGEAFSPYSKQFVHSKSSQYKKMKQEWRTNVYLARSKIQGLGLYAARDLAKHTMVIEYIGELIRSELAESREKQYEAKNHGIYMFRLDEERVVDATLSGGLARYINHSCNPNCVAETVEVERDKRIIIFAKRRINRGEELAYDYKFDIEDDQHKIPCNCGAFNCKKWMN